MTQQVIQKILDSGSVAMADLPGILEEISAIGNIFVLKMDGARDSSRLSIIISFPDDPQAAIRIDCDDFSAGMIDVLTRYKAKIEAYEKNCV